MIRLVALALSLALGTWLTSLARELPGPAWSAESPRSRPFDLRAPGVWAVTMPSDAPRWRTTEEC